MTEEEIKALQEANEAMKVRLNATMEELDSSRELMSRIYHQTMADEAAETEGTNIFVSPQTVAEMRKVGRWDINRFNHFLRNVKEGARPVTQERALKDLEALRDEMDTVTNLAYRLYDHHDVSYGSATLGHLSRIFAFYVRDATETFAQSIRDKIDAPA
ncbi:hypothetical protein [Castellaniella sp.]|uniref:hypothetical protein n=1 Tax=Castellaniella sp. TaxID=1955812 RepID=UPI002AFF955C|nr:hypothetical protein [Castellaniella sp.]